jgi:hypothetical protein
MVKQKALKVIAIYDNGGKTLDRYTVYYDFVSSRPGEMKQYMCLGMNAAPFHPQGIGQHSSGQLGRHNGKRISLEDLPADCQQAVKNDLASD